jgi:ADP-ribose pyrophosphatase YjhB (NUDIX family)
MQHAQSLRQVSAHSDAPGSRITLGVRGVIVDNQDRVQLLRHRYQAGWHVPGGGFERNETADTALNHELLEERDVVLIGALRLVGIYKHFNVLPGDHIAYYYAQNWEQKYLPPPTVTAASLSETRARMTLPSLIVSRCLRSTRPTKMPKTLSSAWASRPEPN